MQSLYFRKPSSHVKKQFPPKFFKRNTHLITICSFWLIKQVDRSIEPLAGILGNGCDSSQHHRTSRTNSIQSTAIANNMYIKTKSSHKYENNTAPRDVCVCVCLSSCPKYYYNLTIFITFIHPNIHTTYVAVANPKRV